MSQKALLILLGFWSCIQPAALPQQQQPDHLEPIVPYEITRHDYKGYAQLVFDTLIGSDMPELWMLSLPAFSPENALILRSKPLKRKGEDAFAPDQLNEWTLEFAMATKAIAFVDGLSELKLRKGVPVERKTITINEPLALVVQRAWIAVLRLTRYPDNADHLGNDGVVYQFHARDERASDILFGQTWSPQSGLPAEFVALAQKLRELIEADIEQRSHLTAKCIADAQRLEDNAKAAAKATIKIRN